MKEKLRCINCRYLSVSADDWYCRKETYYNSDMEGLSSYWKTNDHSCVYFKKRLPEIIQYWEKKVDG